jgi:hypothetical protein
VSRVIDLPGHSPGSIGLEVETEDGVCLIVGDAIRNAGVAQRGRHPLVFWNAEKADASIRRCVQSGALIYPGHDRPFRLRDGEVTYASPFSMTLTGVGSNVCGGLVCGETAAAGAVGDAGDRGAAAGLTGRLSVFPHPGLIAIGRCSRSGPACATG